MGAHRQIESVTNLEGGVYRSRGGRVSQLLAKASASDVGAFDGGSPFAMPLHRDHRTALQPDPCVDHALRRWVGTCHTAKPVEA